jgi:phosphoribosylaminoimidazole-succinocarboxamide synthase
VRRYLVDQGYRGEGPIPVIPDDVRVEATRRYIEAVDRITGAQFVPNLEDPTARMKKNLATAGLSA